MGGFKRPKRVMPTLPLCLVRVSRGRARGTKGGWGRRPWDRALRLLNNLFAPVSRAFVLLPSAWWHNKGRMGYNYNAPSSASSVAKANGTNIADFVSIRTLLFLHVTLSFFDRSIQY